MLSRRRMMCAVLNKSKEELSIPFKTDEFILDGMVDSTNTLQKVANHKGVELGKQYKLTYNYYFKILEVNSLDRNDIGVRFVAGFNYGYGYRINAAAGVYPSQLIHEGVETQLLTCVKTEASGLEFLRVRISNCKVICRVWNVSLTEI